MNYNSDFRKYLNFKNLKNALQDKHSPYRKGLVDILGGGSGSILLGTPIDFYSGASTIEIFATRTNAIPINAILDTAYGRWKDKLYELDNITPGSKSYQKRIVDLAAFNTFQTPLYGLTLGIGTFFPELQIEPEKVKDGMINLFLLSPVIGPVFNMYMDQIRKIFNVDTSEERVEYLKEETKL